MYRALIALLIAAPLASAQHRMKVTPGEATVERERALALEIQTAAPNRGWQASNGEDWNVRVSPAGLAKVELRQGRLFLVGQREGEGVVHIWHKSALSWMGLYSKLKLTVTPPRAAPVPVPSGGARMLRVYRLDREVPGRISTNREIDITPGERLPLVLYGFSRRRFKVPVEPTVHDGSRSCQVLDSRENRFTLKFSDRLREGAVINVAIGDRLSGQRETFRFRVRRAEQAQHLTVWVKIGLAGGWELLDGNNAIAVKRGQLMFLRVVAGNRDQPEVKAAVAVRFAGADGGAQLTRSSAKTWALTTGFGAAGETQLEVSAPGARSRQLAISFVR